MSGLRLLLRSLKEKIKIGHAWQVVKRNNHPPAGSPVFSVVIPIYDRTDVVREAIESILAQTFVNFELLLVCDGSPPETRALVEAYGEHPQVRLFSFSKSSGNACRGRNHGIKNAKGSYISFLDSDDLAMPDRLERTLFHMVLRKVDLVAGAIECIVEGRRSVPGVTHGQVVYTQARCTYDMLLERNWLSTCTVSVRRTILEKFGGFREEMRYREDHELWLRLAGRGCRIYNAPEVLAKYRIHDGNAEQKYLEDDNQWYALTLKMHKQPYVWS